MPERTPPARYPLTCLAIMTKQNHQDSKIWLARSSKTYGPYTTESIREFIDQGKCSKLDLAWDRAENKWIPLHNLLDLSELTKNQETKEKSDEIATERAEKIIELLDSDREEFAIDLLLSSQCTKVFEILLGKRKMKYRHYGIPQNEKIDDWLEISTRFDFELLLQCPADAQIDPFLQIREKKGLNISFSWELKVSDLQGFKNLKVLRFDPNPGSSLSLDGLIEFENLDHLSLLKCKHYCPSIEPVFTLTNLKKLILGNYCQDLEALENLQELEKLVLDGSGEGRSTIGGIANLCNLKSLSLSGWEDLESLAGLQKLDKLEELNLCDCKKISSIEPLLALPNLSKVETGWSRLKIPWSLDAFKLIVRTGLSFDCFREQIYEYEDGPELAEEMLAGFQSLDADTLEELENQDFEDLVHLVFVCAERFNLKKWFNPEREALGGDAFNFLAHAASKSPSKLLIVAKYNNGQCYSNVYAAREYIDRAIALYVQEKHGLKMFISFLERCTENGIHPDGVSKICRKIKHLSLHEMEIWDHQEWKDEFEAESGSYLCLPSIDKFENLESYAHELPGPLPEGLEKLPNLSKLYLYNSFEAEELNIPESMIKLREIFTEDVENLRTLNDLSVFPNLETIDLCGCYQLKKPDWLQKLDPEKVELIPPDWWEEESN